MTGPVAEVNREMSDIWNGAEGDYWAAHAAGYEGVSAGLRPQLFAAAAIVDGEHVLDIGCGAGLTSRVAAAATPSGRVLGIDLSRAMLDRAAALARAEGLVNVRFAQGDAQVYPFDEEFDVAMSQFGSMFFGDPVAAFRNIGSALRHGGRLALMSWQEMARTEWALAVRRALAAGRPLPDTAPSGPGPYAHADPDVVRRILTGAGFVDVDLSAAEAMSSFGKDADEAFAFVQGMAVTTSMLADVDDATRRRALADLRAELVAHETPDGVLFSSAAWIITAVSR